MNELVYILEAANPGTVSLEDDIISFEDIAKEIGKR